MTLFLRTPRSMFTSQLSRQLGLWVFAGILGIEVLIFLPSVYRRKNEQLAIIAMVSKATVQTIASVAPNADAIVNHLGTCK